MRDTLYLPLQKSQLGAYQDDLKAALNQATWKRSTLWKKWYKTTTKTWHITLLLVRAVDLKICLILHPVPLSYSDQSNWDNSEMILRNRFPQNENIVIIHPHVLVKTTPEVWSIIYHTVVSLRGSICQPAAKLLELALSPLYSSRKHTHVNHLLHISLVEVRCLCAT